jgi:hypothetical protein
MTLLSNKRNDLTGLLSLNWWPSHEKFKENAHSIKNDENNLFFTFFLATLPIELPVFSSLDRSMCLVWGD